MEPGEFASIPTLYLQKRRLVDQHGEEVERDPVPRVRELARKGPVCVVDLDGWKRNKADLDTLRKMGEKGNLWADAGSRFGTDAMDVLVAGAERIVLRWHALAGEQELREIAEMSDAVLLGLEYREGRLLPSYAMGGDEGKAIALAREVGAGLAVFKGDAAGTRAGLDRGLAGRFESSGLERYYGGGLRDRQDALDLQTMGYAGCFVGAAREGWG